MKIAYFIGLLFETTLLIGQPKVLHYDETTGYDHGTSMVSMNMFESIGVNQGFVVQQDSDGSQFTKSNLSGVDLVVFSNTSGSSGLNESQKKALEWYLDTLGGSLMGIHAASDTYRHSSANGGGTGAWDWYAETLGGSVQQNPNHTSQNHVDTISLINAHPSADGLTLPWIKEEEYYYWENGYLNGDILTILQVAETGQQSYDMARPVAWSRMNSIGSKIFYTSLGHKTSNFTGTFPSFEILISDAIAWLISDGALPLQNSSFKATTLDEEHKVLLEWIHLGVMHEINYEVEHSVDGMLWSRLQGITDLRVSAGASDYQFIHEDPVYGTNYYRLEMKSENGHVAYSKTIEIQFHNDTQIIAFPNPTSDQLHLRLPKGQEIQYTLNDVQSNIVKSGTLQGAAVHTISLEQIPRGVYFLRLKENTLKISVF